MTLEKIKLKDWIRTGRRETDVDESYTYEDLPLKVPAEVHIHCRLNATGVDVRGNYKTVVEEPCDRCCELYERPLGNAFDERFVYQSFIDEAPAGDMELHTEDFYETIGPEGVLDLKDLIHQYIVMAMSTDRVCNRATCEIRH